MEALRSAGLWVKVNGDLRLSKHTLCSGTFCHVLMGALHIFLLCPRKSEGACPGMVLGLHEAAVFCSIPVYGKPHGGCGDASSIWCLEEDGVGVGEIEGSHGNSWVKKTGILRRT